MSKISNIQAFKYSRKNFLPGKGRKCYNFTSQFAESFNSVSSSHLLPMSDWPFRPSMLLHKLDWLPVSHRGFHWALLQDFDGLLRRTRWAAAERLATRQVLEYGLLLTVVLYKNFNIT